MERKNGERVFAYREVVKLEKLGLENWTVTTLNLVQLPVSSVCQVERGFLHRDEPISALPEGRGYTHYLYLKDRLQVLVWKYLRDICGKKDAPLHRRSPEQMERSQLWYFLLLLSHCRSQGFTGFLAGGRQRG